MLNYITAIISAFEFLYRILGKFHLPKLIITLLVIVVSIHSYFIFFADNKLKPQTRQSEYIRAVLEKRVIAMMSETLQACGDHSYLTWSILEILPQSDYIVNSSSAVLTFKSVISCQKSRAKQDTTCIVDISRDSIAYRKQHKIDKESLKFINEETLLPNQLIFQELSPICFSLINKDGTLTKDSTYLELNAPSFYKIIKRRNLAVQQLCVIKVRQRNREGNPVVYLFTISFVDISKKSCSLNKTGKQVGDYLIPIATLSKQLLE